MSKIDIKALKQNVDIVQVISRYGIELKKSGPRWVARCPFHSESSASFTVSKQKYKCFGCGVAGDAIDFVMNHGGRSFPEALKELEDPFNNAGIVPGLNQEAPKYKPVEWTPIEPRAPFKTPDTTHWEFGKASKVWYYRNTLGHPVCLVCRFDLPGGKKQVWPLTFCRDTNGNEQWRWKGLTPPRPLYNLNHITLRDSEPIMIGEGEKTADAMHSLFPEYTCTTWIGGGEGAKATDWSPIFGREILIWPDNDKDKTYGNGPRKGEVMDWWDQPGNKVALWIANHLKDHCPQIRFVKSPLDAPCGWDVADIDWTIEEARAYLAENIIDIPVPEAPATPKIKAPPAVNHDTGEILVAAAETVDTAKNDVEDLPANLKLVRGDQGGGDKPPAREKDPGIRGGGYFKMLGYQKDVNVNLYHFYSYKSKSVISLSPSAMTKPNLLQLAPLNWWEDQFPRYGKGGVQISGFELDSAQNWLINESVTCRVFNSKWIRGRGAWIDGKDTVIHCGENLIVNGRPTQFEDYTSKFIYEIGEDIGFKMPSPLDKKKASVLLEVLSLCNWERDIDAYLLAGWCVLAPVCGALQWRPHIWLTGSAGTGKSWIFQFLVRRLLGESAMSVQGETSEAGLRQMLKHDALPVVFDEAEGEDKKAQDRMADVIGLMRSSSASDGGIMAKGSSAGRANTYRIRSCFAFASIAYQITHQSDRTRITLLSLKKVPESAEKTEKWKLLQKKYNDTITEEYAAALRSRTINMLPLILENAGTFSTAAAAELGQQRAGDQVGVLLAGAYALTSNKKISYNDALAWIQSKDWTEERAQEHSRDELALIHHILNQISRIESSHGIQERNIGELVRIAAGLHTDPAKAIDMEQANDRLGRLSMKVTPTHLIIGNSVDVIHKYLSGTHWVKNYNKILMRLDGATDSEPTRFASGFKIRATKIPLSTLFMGEQGKLFNTLVATLPPIVEGVIGGKTENPDSEEKLPF